MKEEKKSISILTFLRSFSIILVLLSHNPFYPIPSAVVGVDIFFLISGYLITKILFNGNKKILNFYFHRVRRILPSFLVTISFTLLYCKYFASPTYYQSVKNLAIRSMMFTNNFYQIKLSHNYFQDFLENPLSSFWSLSVEIQLYLLFPLMFLLMVRLLPTHLTKLAISLLLVVIVIYTLLASDNQYFQPIPRLGAFLLGSLTYLYLYNQKSKISNYHIKNLNLIYSLVVLLIVIITKNQVNPYPNVITFTIIIITSLLIIHQGEYKISKLSRYVGERSYNIYLVYLPVTVFVQLSHDSKVFYPFTLLLILIFAEFLYQIDKIFRIKLKTPLKVIPLLSILVVFNIFLISLPSSQAIKNISSINSKDELLNSINYSLVKGYKPQSLDQYQGFSYDERVFTNENSNTINCKTTMICMSPRSLPYQNTLLYLADSTSREFIVTLSQKAKKEKMNFIYYNLTSCDVTGLPLDNFGKGPPKGECVNLYNSLFPFLGKFDRQNLSIVFQQASDPNRTLYGKTLTIQQRANSFKKTILNLKKNSSHVSVISEAPLFVKNSEEYKLANNNNSNFAVDCLVKSIKTSSCQFPLSNNLTKALVLTNKATSSSLSIPFVDLSDYLCYQNNCPMEINHILVYTDPLHISSKISQYISPLVLQKLDIKK